MATNHLHTREPHPHIDDPENWALCYGRPPFDTDAYNARLRRVGGAYEGRSWYRLVWCPEALTPLDGQLLPRYFQWKEDEQFISPPRWLIEKWVHPGVLEPNWEATRWIDGHDKGALPREGLYIPFLKVEEHDPGFSCCARSGGETCYGYYTFPAEAHLDLVRRDVEAWHAAPYRAPDTGLTADDIAAAFDYHEYRESERRAKKLAEEQAIGRDWVTTHHHRFTDPTPTTLKHGRFHFMPGTDSAAWHKTESGLIVPAA